MYARDIADRTLTFAVSGMLWEGSLVMVDIETGSYWSHLLGKAMQGPLAGKTLAVIPSTMTDWETWRSRYPQTTVAVMGRTAGEYLRELHQQGNHLVIGIVSGDESRAWPFALLRSSPVLNETIGGRAILVCFDRNTGTASIFERSVGGQLLEFEHVDGQLVDQQTKSKWDRVTGMGLTAPMSGKQLRRLPGIVSADHAWMKFYP